MAERETTRSHKWFMIYVSSSTSRRHACETAGGSAAGASKGKKGGKNPKKSKAAFGFVSFRHKEQKPRAAPPPPRPAEAVPVAGLRGGASRRCRFGAITGEIGAAPPPGRGAWPGRWPRPRR